MIFGVWLECTLQWEWQQSGVGVYTPSWSVHSVRVWVGRGYQGNSPMHGHHAPYPFTLCHGMFDADACEHGACNVEFHEDVIKWKHFPHYWSFVRVIHRSPVNSPPQRSVTRNFDVFFDLRLNKGLRKQSRRRWCETPSRPLLRHCNMFPNIGPIATFSM